jgi:hypothetical protein
MLGCRVSVVKERQNPVTLVLNATAIHLLTNPQLNEYRFERIVEKFPDAREAFGAPGRREGEKEFWCASLRQWFWKNEPSIVAA